MTAAWAPPSPSNTSSQLDNRSSSSSSNNGSTKPILSTPSSSDHHHHRSIASQIVTVPNLITLSRIVIIPFILYFIVDGRHMYACLLFVYAAVSDFLDGYIARMCSSQASFVGSILDPLADKLLIGSLAITLTFNHMIPLGLMILIIARDLTLIGVSLYIRYTLLEKPVTFWKYINLFGYSRTRVKAHWISKINTVIQLVLIIATMPSCLFDYQGSSALVGLQYLTGITTVLSWITYLVTTNNYEIVHED